MEKKPGIPHKIGSQKPPSTIQRARNMLVFFKFSDFLPGLPSVSVGAKAQVKAVRENRKNTGRFSEVLILPNLSVFVFSSESPGICFLYFVRGFQL